MKGNTHYTPRLIGSFLLSVILAWGLNMLLSLVLVSTLVLVPLLLNSIFDFSFSEALCYASIPVVGKLMAVFSGDDFQIRLAILIIFFIIVIAVVILGGLTSTLIKVVSGSRVMTILSGTVLLFSFVNMVSVLFFEDNYNPDLRGFWYNALSVCLLVILFLIDCYIIYFCWNDEEYD